MPNIYLPDDVKHWEFSQVLTDLGGDPSTDFRLSIAWDGQHYFEVTDELYKKWSKSLPKGASPSEAVPTNTGTAEKDAEPAGEKDATEPDKDATPATDGTSPTPAEADKQETDGEATSPATADSTATEPPAQSEKDDAAAAEKDTSSTEPAGEPETEAAEPAQSSGTKRKPSAARSTSRRG